MNRTSQYRLQSVGVFTRRRRPAFTLLELLTVMAIISLLVGIILPSLGAARVSGQRTKCLALLYGLGVASAAYAGDDESSQPLAAHPIADDNPDHDEGFYDYGGATGAANVFGGNRYGPLGPRTAATRPLNRYLLGTVGDTSQFSAFQCPGDDGWPNGMRGNLWVQWDANLVGQSFYKAVGTSYQANAARVPALGSPVDFFSIGPWLRPISRIPLPAATILYCESILWLAAFHTDNMYGSDPKDILLDGWHGSRPQFNVVFADGGARTIRLDLYGFVGHEVSSDPDYAAFWLGQDGWRFHCRPDELIPDPPLSR